MRRRYFYSSLVLFVIIVTCIEVFAQQDMDNLVWGKVIQIHDGDTIAIKDDHGKTVRVQLAYLDAPDFDNKSGQTQPMHGESTKSLLELLLKKEVIVESLGVDKFGRIEGIVFLDKLNVNHEMLRRGMAEIYFPVRQNPSKYNKIHVSQFKKAEDLAREHKSGIWANPDYISPYKFRRRNK